MGKAADNGIVRVELSDPMELNLVLDKAVAKLVDVLDNLRRVVRISNA